MGQRLADRYLSIKDPSGGDSTDSGSKVVKYKTYSSKNSAGKHEAEYYLKVFLD